MPRRSKLSDFSWQLLLAFTGCIDGGQVALDAALASGVLINRFIDLIYGPFLALVLVFSGFKFDSTVWKWLIGSFVAEEIPLLDVAPLWSLDVWKFWKMDQARGKAAIESEAASDTDNMANLNEYRNSRKKSSPDDRRNQRAA